MAALEPGSHVGTQKVVGMRFEERGGTKDPTLKSLGGLKYPYISSTTVGS